jgi:hypothetical protein
MKPRKVRIPVTVTYTGYYVFEYEDCYSMDAIMDVDLEATPENKERHWEHGLAKLPRNIRETLEEYGVYDVLDEDSIKCSVKVGLGPTEEQKLRKIFDAGYEQIEEGELTD